MPLTQELEYQQISRALQAEADYLESDRELREIAIKRAKHILEFGSEHGATKIFKAVVDLERLRLEREIAASGSHTASIRLSAPANLSDVHALLEAMRQPAIASDANLPQMASVPQAPDAGPQPGGETASTQGE
jgi:hypothetical protein